MLNEEQKAKRVAYNKSARGKASRAKYMKSSKGLIAVARGELRRRRRLGMKPRQPASFNHRAWKLMRNYGITEAAYGKMLSEQNGHCALCPRLPAQEFRGVLCVDHDHMHGYVRGLLCYGCNVALGRFGDNQEGLERALSYIKRGGQRA